MQEIFYEESAKIQEEASAARKYYIAKVFMIISYVLAVIWGIFCLTFLINLKNILLSLIFSLIPLALFIVSGIILGKLKDKFYVDYDYTFVSGSIRFSKVIKNIKRKHIINFDTSDIEKIGLYGSELYEKYSKMPDIKTKILTSNSTPSEGKDFYYIVANVGGDKYVFIVECSELFIVNILKFTNRTVLDQEILNKKKNKNN